jgi:hypothetical protein
MLCYQTGKNPVTILHNQLNSHFMIKANEIRVGNWVKAVRSDCWYQVNKQNFSAYVDNIHTEPIPITNEILEKCGFDYVDHYSCIIDIWEFKKAVGGGAIFHYNSENSPRSRQVTLRYLHQLQNLYFALTGKELPISL